MNILTVDDEPNALHLLTQNVAEVVEGANVVSFPNPHDALRWAEQNSCDVAFLDIELGDMNGIELGKRLKELNPKTNLIFVTGYLEYAVSAYALHASGYLAKPASRDAIRIELENLRYPMPKPRTDKKISVHCFGNFEVFYCGKPLAFKRGKTRELFAFLVDRHGARVTSGEICARLWEDLGSDKQQKDYLRHLVMDLTRTLEEIGESEVFIRSHNSYTINPDRIECDYYDYLNNIPYAVRAFQGEYMQQYSWAEERIGTIRAGK